MQLEVLNMVGCIITFIHIHTPLHIHAWSCNRLDPNSFAQFPLFRKIGLCNCTVPEMVFCISTREDMTRGIFACGVAIQCARLIDSLVQKLDTILH